MLICSNCGTENKAGRQFCVECGSSLVAGCPNCGSSIEPSEKFCGTCGTPIGGPRQSAAASASAPVAERRLVSVLFADLVGFTAFAEGRDAEDVRDMLTRYFDLAADVMTR